MTVVLTEEYVVLTVRNWLVPQDIWCYRWGVA